MRRPFALLSASLLALAAPSFADGTPPAAPAPTPTQAPAPAPVPPPPPAPAPLPVPAKSAPAAPVPVAPSSWLGEIRKAHNYDLGGGSLGVILTVPSDVVALAGETVAVVVWFYDAAGNPVRSNLTGWGDATNHLRVVSRDFVPPSAREAADFEFRVPYAAFPTTREGRHAVEARALLVRRVGNGRVVVARRSTTFFVE